MNLRLCNIGLYILRSLLDKEESIYGFDRLNAVVDDINDRRRLFYRINNNIPYNGDRRNNVTVFRLMYTNIWSGAYRSTLIIHFRMIS